MPLKPPHLTLTHEPSHLQFERLIFNYDAYVTIQHTRFIILLTNPHYFSSPDKSEIPILKIKLRHKQFVPSDTDLEVTITRGLTNSVLDLHLLIIKQPIAIKQEIMRIFKIAINRKLANIFNEIFDEDIDSIFLQTIINKIFEECIDKYILKEKDVKIYFMYYYLLMGMSQNIHPSTLEDLPIKRLKTLLPTLLVNHSGCQYAKQRADAWFNDFSILIDRVYDRQYSTSSLQVKPIILLCLYLALWAFSEYTEFSFKQNIFAVITVFITVCLLPFAEYLKPDTEKAFFKLALRTEGRTDGDSERCYHVSSEKDRKIHIEKGILVRCKKMIKARSLDSISKIFKSYDFLLQDDATSLSDLQGSITETAFSASLVTRTQRNRLKGKPSILSFIMEDKSNPPSRAPIYETLTTLIGQLVIHENGTMVYITIPNDLLSDIKTAAIRDMLLTKEIRLVREVGQCGLKNLGNKNYELKHPGVAERILYKEQSTVQVKIDGKPQSVPLLIPFRIVDGNEKENMTKFLNKMK